VHFSGPVDALADDALAADVTAVVRELLVNVARHACAGRVDLGVTANGSALTVSVVDDGLGPGDVGRRSGLDNLRQRAIDRGGTFTLTGPGVGGENRTRALWEVPIP
jgi:signal transduction histidine kinase